MARSSVKTLLPLEVYARIMSIPGWHFNQVEHPERETRGGCDECWLQSGYSSDPNRIVGRDEIAQAIAEAEYQIAHTAGFWPAPRWFCQGSREPAILWPDPVRGQWIPNPALRTRWGYLIQAGVEQWDQLNEVPIVVLYSDPDDDGVDEWATITFGLYLDTVDECEVAILPTGYDPSQNWEIKPLQVEINDAGVLIVQGWRWQFVDPAVWLTTTCPQLDDDDAFLGTVDIWRHYNKPYPAAQVRWTADACATVPCSATCQDACITVLNERVGMFAVTPATYSGTAWATASWAACRSPKDVILYYQAGYRSPECNDCTYMSPSMQRAIVSLANCYMAEEPCGCNLTHERWTRDRELQPMESYNVAMANSHFGTTARGAVFAYSVVQRIPALGRGG